MIAVFDTNVFIATLVLSNKFHLSDEVTTAVQPVDEAIAHMIDHDVRVSNICRDSSDDNILSCARTENLGAPYCFC